MKLKKHTISKQIFTILIKIKEVKVQQLNFYKYKRLTKFCQMKKPEDSIMILEIYIMLMKKNLKRKMKTSRKKIIHNKIDNKNNMMIFGIKIKIKTIINKVKNKNNMVINRINLNIKKHIIKLMILTLSKVIKDLITT
jgi:hypothetical protein